MAGFIRRWYISLLWQLNCQAFESKASCNMSVVLEAAPAPGVAKAQQKFPSAHYRAPSTASQKGAWQCIHSKTKAQACNADDCSRGNSAARKRARREISQRVCDLLCVSAVRTSISGHGPNLAQNSESVGSYC